MWTDGGYTAGRWAAARSPSAATTRSRAEPAAGPHHLEHREHGRAADFDRLEAAGAIVVREPYGFEGTDGVIATLADPDDNYFQLMSPMSPDADAEVDALA